MSQIYQFLSYGDSGEPRAFLSQHDRRVCVEQFLATALAAGAISHALNLDTFGPINKQAINSLSALARHNSGLEKRVRDDLIGEFYGGRIYIAEVLEEKILNSIRHIPYARKISNPKVTQSYNSDY